MYIHTVYISFKVTSTPTDKSSFGKGATSSRGVDHRTNLQTPEFTNGGSRAPKVMGLGKPVTGPFKT